MSGAPRKPQLPNSEQISAYGCTSPQHHFDMRALDFVLEPHDKLLRASVRILDLQRRLGRNRVEDRILWRDDLRLQRGASFLQGGAAAVELDLCLGDHAP